MKNIKLNVFVCSLFLGMCSVFAQVDSLKVYFIGNSVTENLKPEAFESIVKGADKKITWGWDVIYGQALSYIWEHSGEGFIEPPYNGFENALSAYEWDALTLQPYQRKISNSDGDFVSVFKFLDYAKLNSPDIQPYIYQRWPRLPAGVEATAQSWDSLWLRSYDPQNTTRYDSRDYFETLTDTIRSQQTDTKKCLMIPVGEVMHQINKEMADGNLPGFDNIWEVYNDDIHMKGMGSYIIAATFYAVLYKSDPRGISAPGFYGWFTPEKKAVIQQAVYDVILGYKDTQDKTWSGVDELTNVSTNSVTENQFTLIQSSNSLNITFHAPPPPTGQLVQSRISKQECTLNLPNNGVYILCIEDISDKTIFPTQRIIAK